jgi:hypothetical protein
VFAAPSDAPLSKTEKFVERDLLDPTKFASRSLDAAVVFASLPKSRTPRRSARKLEVARDFATPPPESASKHYR